ncbi:PREDICTED: gag_pre-integrs domain-containing [Prunus dulcis]|uniref:PREDICTED: gag_pre-integrs domain-containing n=1 Tax=Prunus dulcis TaxID=3755 RepID=A0A5E4ENE3_PRUDU|nr:PREDICTED: gag_pre-integrs domain-containing [Prunus dulcis]
MAIALSSLNGRVVFVTVEKMLLHVACHAFSHASPSAKSRKLSTKDEVVKRNCAKNLVCQKSLVVIVVFISAVTRVPSAKNMLSSNLEALTPPKSSLGMLKMVNSLRLVRYVSPSGSVVIPLLISHEFKQFWFDMYEVNCGSKVMIGDGSVYSVEGTGTIKVKMHDNVVRTLAISTKNDLDDDTQLWHLRLGHMSERAMQELHKQKLLKGVHSCKLDTANIVPWGSSQR